MSMKYLTQEHRTGNFNLNGCCEFGRFVVFPNLMHSFKQQQKVINSYINKIVTFLASN